MKKILLLCGMVLACASVASAAGVNLAWDNCGGTGGLHTKTFACASNTGSNTLVASVRAPAGVDMWNSFEAEYIFNFGGPQPAWWQLRNQTGQTAQCRNGSLSANAVAAPVLCVDPYGGAGGGGIGTYQNAPGGATNLARLTLVFAVAVGNEVQMTENEEYFVAKVVVNNAKTVGTTSCAGCQQPACITLNNVKVVQPAGAPGGNQDVSTAAESNTALWQTTDNASCLATPATRTTWGSVKSLYR
jgi:opacity protein-like surface antigen